jgi:hypothetical protein
LARIAQAEYQAGRDWEPRNSVTIAYLLQSGFAAVYDKRARTEVTTIRFWDYAYFCGPLCGRGTWSFYLPDGTLFLEATYMMA